MMFGSDFVYFCRVVVGEMRFCKIRGGGILS